MHSAYMLAQYRKLVCPCYKLCCAVLFMHGREMEDSLRHLYRTERAAPALYPLHVGLIDVYDDSDGSTSLSKRIKAARGSSGCYPLLLEGINPRFKRSAKYIVGSLAKFQKRFDKFYPGLRDALRKCPPTSQCGWFIAGGAVLRALLNDKAAEPLFATSDVDIFIWARGEPAAAAKAATDLAQSIYEALIPDDDTPPRQKDYSGNPRSPTFGWKVNRTLFTLNMTGFFTSKRRPSNRGKEELDIPIQVILRVYNSPAEVLLGFDVDCTTVGFDGERVWALPRGLDALANGYSVLNPIHSWPIQPSYELRLAKYAARGFPVAVPGLELQHMKFEDISSKRITTLKGLARLIHIHLSFLAPAGRGIAPTEYSSGNVLSADDAKLKWEWAGKGGEMRCHMSTPPSELGSNFEDMMRNMFGERDPYETNLTMLPTDIDSVKMIIE